MSKNWKPPGELYESGSLDNATFEIWKGSLADKAIQQLVKRIQILIPFFIEGGQAINLEELDWSLRRWTVFLLYKKTQDGSTSLPYTLMGYSTVYRYFYLPSTSVKKAPIARPATLDFQYPLSSSLSSNDQIKVMNTSTLYLPCRSRISQFLIFPPFQKGGNGSRFYEAIFSCYLNDAQTVEITVEDPNESFDDLRDLNDLKRLRSMSEFVSLRINSGITLGKKGRLPTDKIVNLTAIETLRKKMKIASRQFLRLVEMQLLSLIPTSIRKSLILEPKKGDPLDLKAKEHEYYLWRLLVKQRLYRHNKDSLIQLDRAERIDKLEDALDNVEADYARLLRALDQRSDKSVSIDDSSGKRPATQELHGDEPLTKRVKFRDG
jgi:histone acetyltransferase 1